MPVIDEIYVRDGNTRLPIDSYDNTTIDEIVIDDVTYHFAKENSVTGTGSATCANAVAEPLINCVIEGNSVGELVTDTTDANYGKYKIPVTTRGVNFINVDDFKNGNFKVNVDGSCTLSWTLSSRFSAYNTNLSHIPAGSKLVFKISILEATTNYKYVLIQLTYSNGTTKYLACKNSTPITLEDTIKHISLYIHNSEEKGSYITFKEFGLYYENEYIGYESYVESITTNIYLDEPMQGEFNCKDNNITIMTPPAQTLIVEVNTEVTPGLSVDYWKQISPDE